jgi:hypothetical protein
MEAQNEKNFIEKDFYSTFDKIKLPQTRKDLDIESRINECMGFVNKNTKIIASQVKIEEKSDKPSFYSVLKLGYKKIVMNNKKDERPKNKSKILASIFKTKPKAPKNFILANQMKSQVKSRNNYFNRIETKINQESNSKIESKTQRDNFATLSDTSEYFPSIRDTNHSSQGNNRIFSNESIIRRPKNKKEIFLTHIVPKRKKSGNHDDLFFDIIEKKIKSLSHSKNNSKVPKLENLNFFNLNTQVQTESSQSFPRKFSETSIGPSRSRFSPELTKKKGINIKMSFFNNKINKMIKSHDSISNEISSNRITSREKYNLTNESLKETLKINPTKKQLDVITNFSGINNYIDKGKADFIRYSDTLANMNSLLLFNRGSDYYIKYEDYARAANVKEFYDKEYNLVSTEKLSQNNFKIKKTIKSMILTKNKVLKKA